MSSPFRFFRGPVRRDRDLCVFITAVDFGLWSEVFHGIVCVCVFIAAVPVIKSCSRGGRGIVEDMCYERSCVYCVCLLLQYLL